MAEQQALVLLPANAMTSSTAISPTAATRPPRRIQSVAIDAPLLRSDVLQLLQHPADRVRPSQLTAQILDTDGFADAAAAEFDRRQRGGRNCAVASISLFEVPAVRHRLGSRFVFDLISEVIELVRPVLAASDLMHMSEDGEISILARDNRVSDAADRFDRVCAVLSSRRFETAGRRVLLTPSAGYSTLDDGDDVAQVLRRAAVAREVAATHLDLRPQRWEAFMSLDSSSLVEEPKIAGATGPSLRERLRTPFQVALTYVIGLVIPFLAYWALDAFVIDVTGGVYLLVVACLVLTGLMIVIEAQHAVKQRQPPDPATPYPLATAIVCAYLPNEAATILDTVDAFLDNGYEGGLQIIIAYNTPEELPVEHHLHALADKHEMLDVIRVTGSNSKAQNVNAVLGLARGEFTAMFDADHEPRPGSFERAWKWLSNGYDVVQGHCLTRNGDATKLARMVAVEFESIYAVAHPGRARLHQFGIFGGSNGYWRTELLHETRMRGSMLTEDIDSALRVIERGFKIRSDRDIVSEELGTTTFHQVWNQRLRWSQGWFQVTKQHTTRSWRTTKIPLRQKVGMSYLLAWREFYPWLSLQMFPLILYWLFRGDTLDWTHPLWLGSTLFVLQIGPVQTMYAYRLADPSIKQHKSWFVAFFFFSTFFYTEYKNVIARVAHIKEFMGERSWRVTPRGDETVDLEPVE
ncbi:MAG: glycosyltransferase [Ilumatobacter sp.]